MWLDAVEQSPLLGRGGNGRIYKHPLLNQEYAAKITPYRPAELSEWRRFHHPNVARLLMVTSMAPRTPFCCQLMTLMDSNLRREIPAGGVNSLLEGPGRWGAVVRPNVSHILRGVVRGLAYLHEDMCIQHVDLKASNVLIKRQCSCGDILTCACPEEAKCLVELSDFDSVKRFSQRDFVSPYRDWWPFVSMSPSDCQSVMGTPGYRAPEQFTKLAPVVSQDHLLWNKSLEGPWTDIWSLGLLALSIFLGPSRPEEREEAWAMCCQPQQKSFSRSAVLPELFHALLRVMKFRQYSPQEVTSAASDFVFSCTKVYTVPDATTHWSGDCQ
jgi:serine/threonine protein kinase